LNYVALIAPENAGAKFTVIKITECTLEGSYAIRGELVAQLKPANMLVMVAEAILATTSGVQQNKSVEFPVAGSTLTGQELKFGAKAVGVEGTLGLELTGGEQIGFF
jgi:hypothetical protein